MHNINYFYIFSCIYQCKKIVKPAARDAIASI